ncbi:MAG TPA: recombinase, partial [Sutterella wadsworthensis]|nr:recombinase [Sutterella wadsworthensis]
AETAWRLRQIDLTTYAEIKAVKQLRVHREPTGRALQADESQKLLAAVDEDTGPKAVRDRALIALLLGCGLRRAEVTTL